MKGLRGQIKKIYSVYNLHEPAVRWIFAVEFFLLLGGGVFFGFWGGGGFFFPYMVGALLAIFNFMVLARLLPSLILSGNAKASVVSLLFSFYSRLLLTGIVLLVGIVFLDFRIFPLVMGLSSIVVSIVSWIVRYIVTDNHKEALNHGRSSSSHFAP